jgi:N-carbamoylputrescine amidase
MPKDIRIAAVTMNSRVGETAGNLQKIEQWVAAARDIGAGMACFPEMAVTGYHVREPMGEMAETIPGPSTDHLLRVAQKSGVTILSGLAEKGDAGRIYATHVVISPTGIIGCYRKVHLGPPEKQLFTNGDKVPVFASNGITFGIQLCYDAHFPELTTAMALKGADVIFMPHASPRNTPDEKRRSWMRHLPARAYDNSVYVVACNACGDNGHGLLFPGVAVAISPSGETIQAYAGDEEQMMVVDLNLDLLKNIRSHPMRYFLPNRRPDVYGI